MEYPTKFMTLIAVTLLIVSSITSCNEEAAETKETKEAIVEPTFNLETAKAEIIAANKQFMTLFGAGDSSGVADLYAHDAKFMMNGSPAIAGKENIRSILSAIMNSGISSVDLRTIEVWGTEDLLTEEGELSLFAGDAEVDQGKYLILWEKEDGKWKLYRDIFNSNLAAE